MWQVDWGRVSVFYHGDTPPITAGQITPLGNHPLSRQPWAFELRYLSQYLVGIIIDKLGANAIAATIVMKQTSDKNTYVLHWIWQHKISGRCWFYFTKITQSAFHAKNDNSLGHYATVVWQHGDLWPHIIESWPARDRRKQRFSVHNQRNLLILF